MLWLQSPIQKLFLILLLLPNLQLYSQDLIQTEPTLYTESSRSVTFLIGRIIPHTDSIRFQINRPSFSFNITQELGSTQDKHDYGLQWGFHIPMFGNSITGGMGFMNLYWEKQAKKHINWRYFAGIAAYTKWYQPETNPTQNAIGSRLNVHLGAELQYTLNPHWNLILSGRHTSNGRIALPNLGLNCVEVGANYRWTEKRIATHEAVDRIDTYRQYSTRFEVGSSVGLKENYTPGGPQYPIYTAHVYVYPYSKWMLGTEISYETLDSRFNILYNQGLKKQDFYDVSIVGGGRIKTGRSAATIGVGIYVYNPVLEVAPFFFRVHYALNIWNSNHIKLYAISALKTHYLKANALTFGLSLGVR